MKEITFPALDAKLINIDKITANDYNPNKIAPKEMELLEISIKQDGYTQPIVTYYNQTEDQYIIVDGFHRFLVGVKLNLKKLPVVVINKDMKQRMESTIRHNRARGEHQIDRMVHIVSELVREGRNDHEISVFLGMDPDEVLRLKQQSGIAELFKNHNYSKSWE